LFAALGAAGAAMAQPESVQGRWLTETRHGVVDIAPCGESICGALVESDGIRANPDLRDAHNRNQALRGRQLRGLQILQGFTWRSGAWAGGTIYNAEDGGTYHATITLVDHDHLTLRGCIAWPLCRTQHWTRVN
jgi:uncharacterized protein (DUF2147 family)